MFVENFDDERVGAFLTEDDVGFVLQLVPAFFGANVSVFVVFFTVFFIVEFFAGSGVVFTDVPKLVRGGDAMKSVWFAYIVLVAVVAAAIAAWVASGLGASALVVVPWAAGSFVVTLGLGFTVYNFFAAP